MRPSAIEAWALDIVDSLRRAQDIEDSRVELKSAWISADKAARRIAGHLNASRGESVLWLIGVSESGQVVAISREEFSNWWTEVCSHFDGPVPEVTNVNVFHEDGQFVGLLLEGHQPPYVVRNPQFGTPGGGPVEREVPWREMTSTRSAKHSDLLRVLAPLVELPEIEVLASRLYGEGPIDGQGMPTQPEPGRPCTWHFELELYCIPRDKKPLVLPAHRTSIQLLQAETFGELSPTALSRNPRNPLMLEGRRDHVIDGPKRVEILGSAKVSHSGEPTGPARATVQVRLTGVSRTLVLDLTLAHRGGSSFELDFADIRWIG